MQIGDEVVFNTGAGPEPRAVIRGYIKHIALSNDSDPYELQPAITNITIQIALNDELHTIDIDRTRLMPHNRVSIKDYLKTGYALIGQH